MAFSCVVDDSDIFRAQSFIWLNCLVHLQGVDPGCIFVHLLGGPDDYRDWLASQRVNVVAADAFDARNPYCNKLRQLETFRAARHDHVALMDCDTAWVGSSLPPRPLQVAAKIVDFAKPPEAIIAQIFAAAGMGEPKWRQASFARGPGRTLTDSNNCNGGVYICEGSFMAKLAQTWPRWAQWCLDHAALFQAALKHVDQVSFALAMRELGAEVQQVGPEWNYPAHLTVEALPDIAPEILHHHGRMDDGLRLRPTGVPAADRAIMALNDHVAGFLRRSVYTPRLARAPAS